MELKILYFGIIAEITQKKEEILFVQKKCSLFELKNRLINEYKELDSINFKIAIDKEISTDVILLNSTNEIALLPPFSGG